MCPGELSFDLGPRVLFDAFGQLEVLLLDAEDPATVHFTAHVNEPENRMYHYDNLDLTLQFGAGTPDPRVEKWFQNPFYPPTRTEWTC